MTFKPSGSRQFSSTLRPGCGGTFIATNLDATFPDGPSTTTPGGALAAALTTSTGVTPFVIGKPEPTGLSLIAASWGVPAAGMAMVGDRLDTDIAAGNAFGCLSVLVLTGVSTRAEAESGRAAEKPGVVLRNLNDLPFLLTNRQLIHIDPERSGPFPPGGRSLIRRPRKARFVAERRRDFPCLGEHGNTVAQPAFGPFLGPFTERRGRLAAEAPNRDKHIL